MQNSCQCARLRGSLTRLSRRLGLGIEFGRPGVACDSEEVTCQRSDLLDSEVRPKRARGGGWGDSASERVEREGLGGNAILCVAPWPWRCTISRAQGSRTVTSLHERFERGIVGLSNFLLFIASSFFFSFHHLGSLNSGVSFFFSIMITTSKEV